MNNIFEKIMGEHFPKTENGLNETLKEIFNELITARKSDKQSTPTIPTEPRFFEVIKAIKKYQESTIPDNGMQRLFTHNDNKIYLSSLVSQWDYSSEYLKDQTPTIQHSVKEYLLK